MKAEEVISNVTQELNEDTGEREQEAGPKMSFKTAEGNVETKSKCFLCFSKQDKVGFFFLDTIIK